MTITAMAPGNVSNLTETQAAWETAAVRPRGQYSPEMLRKMHDVSKMYESALSGSRVARAQFNEAMSRDDFQYVMSNVIDKELMERYPGLPKVWPGFARKTVVTDFKAKKLVDLIGGRQRLPRVPELSEYPERKYTDAEYSLQVYKHGDTFGVSWEARQNDDLDSLRNIPDDLAISAVETEDYYATAMFVASTGPDPTFFASGHSNLMSGNPALTVASLSTALTTITSRLDTDGRPVAVPGFVLMVPPGLEVAANNIVHAIQVDVATGSAGAASDAGRPNTLRVNNWLASKINVVVNHWIPTIDVSGNVSNTWYVLPDPQSARPAGAVGFLRGHETPDLRVANDQGMYAGGGMVPWNEGSFSRDDIRFRGRHILGTATIDYFATLVSTGAGS